MKTDVAIVIRKLTALQTQIDKLNSEKIACMNAVCFPGVVISAFRL